VLGPGDIYTSTLACIVVPGIQEALQERRGKLIYVVNLMTKYGQTYNFTAADHIRELERYSGSAIDHILLNTTPLPKEILSAYKEERDTPVEDDLGDDSRVVRADLLASETVTKPFGDVLKRSLIRHDSDKLAEVIKQLCT